MSYDLIIFPTPLDAPCQAILDNGLMVQAVPAVHASGRLGQGFAIPVGTPNRNGVQLLIGSLVQRGLLLLNDGTLPWSFEPTQTAAFVADDFHVPASGTAPFGPVSIVGDHFESGGKRWIWRMTTGFLDYKVFLDGGDLRSLLKQNQDLGARGRRVFLHIVNITDFNPDAYGQAFYDRLSEFVALNAEYEQHLELDVLPDTQYRGWNLNKCQNFWARVNDALDRSGQTHFRSLTNEFDHGGNLVGSPNDYARPAYPLVSQGSAVSDAPCPRPGWGFREFHIQKPWPKIFLCEDMLFNREGVNADGSRWGDAKPIVLTETPRFDESNSATDERLARTLAFESLAFGEGGTFHCQSGKYSQWLQPRQAACARVFFDILGAA